MLASSLLGVSRLAVSLPTMLAGFTRYSRDQSFQVIRLQRRFIAIMAAGSIVGSYLGGKLLGVIPSSVPCRFSQSYSLPRLSRCGGMRRSSDTTHIIIDLGDKGSSIALMSGSDGVYSARCMR